MISNNPFFRFPPFRYPRNYSPTFYNPTNSFSKIESTGLLAKNNSNYSTQQLDIEKAQNNQTSDVTNLHEKKSSNYRSIGPVFINVDGFSNKEEPILSIAGLKLYLDDLIIMCLLFFLYKEDVKDEMLFIILILLLLS